LFQLVKGASFYSALLTAYGSYLTCLARAGPGIQAPRKAKRETTRNGEGKRDRKKDKRWVKREK
jgi:hypothetical protein